MSALETYRRRELQTKWTDTVEKVRKMAGFEHFLRAPPFSQLVRAAQHGPVVMVIGSVHGCSALVIERGCESPQHISLDISYEDVKKLNDRLTRVLKCLGLGRLRNVSLDGGTQARDLVSEEKEMSRILLELWDEVVDPVVEHLELTVRPDAPLRLC
jgi:hypothetical protein